MSFVCWFRWEDCRRDRRIMARSLKSVARLPGIHFDVVLDFFGGILSGFCNEWSYKVFCSVLVLTMSYADNFLLKSSLFCELVRFFVMYSLFTLVIEEIQVASIMMHSCGLMHYLDD